MAGGRLETPVLGEAPCDSALGSPLTEGEASLDPPPRPKPADTSAQRGSFLPGFSPGLTGSLPRGRSEAEAAGDGDSSSNSSSRGRSPGPEAMAESGPSCTQARTRLWLSALDPNSGEGLSERGPGLLYGQQLGGAQLGLRPGGEKKKKKGVAGGYRKLQMPEPQTRRGLSLAAGRALRAAGAPGPGAGEEQGLRLAIPSRGSFRASPAPCQPNT